MVKSIGIIGSGPGGYVAAIRAGQLGAKVYLIEKDDLGGTCLNKGCIPTKTYYNNAKIISNIKKSEEYGIKVSDYKIDGEGLKARKNQVVNQLVSGISRIIKSYSNIEYIVGEGRVKDKGLIEVKERDGNILTIEVDNIIIASGSKVKLTETKGIDLEGVITSDNLLDMNQVPKSLLVVGGGVIGIEFASIYKELGSDVSVFISTMLRGADREMARRLIPMLRKQGIKIYNDIRAKEITRSGDGLTTVGRYKNKEEEVSVSSDYVLIATGREPNTKDLHLDELGIEYTPKGIVVDEDFKTSMEGVYAIGDAIGGYPLAHVASAEGIYTVEKIMGIEPEVNLEVVPQTVFSLPEFSFVGKTEEDLKEAGIDYRVSKFMMGANGKALTMGEPDGLVKLLADKEGRILGAHIISDNSSDLIGEISLAMVNNLKVEDIIKTIHVHPTLSEAIYEAGLGIENRAIHMEKPRERKKRRR